MATKKSISAKTPKGEAGAHKETATDAPQVFLDIPPALKMATVVFSNISYYNLNMADISICYGSQFDNNEVALPGFRVVMTHENFMSHMANLMPVYELLTEYYDNHRPRLPDIESEEGKALTELAKRLGNKRNE